MPFYFTLWSFGFAHVDSSLRATVSCRAPQKLA